MTPEAERLGEEEKENLQPMPLLFLPGRVVKATHMCSEHATGVEGVLAVRLRGVLPPSSEGCKGCGPPRPYQELELRSSSLSSVRRYSRLRPVEAGAGAGAGLLRPVEAGGLAGETATTGASLRWRQQATLPTVGSGGGEAKIEVGWPAAEL